MISRLGSYIVAVTIVFVCSGAEPNVEKLRSEAEKGNVDSQFALGLAYASGNGVEKDLAKAAELYRKAADQGNAKAMNNLGSCYSDGTGVERDEKKAVEWYR